MRKVKTKWVVNLPVGSEPKVKVGEVVVCGQVLAEEAAIKEEIYGMVDILKGWSLLDLKKMESQLVGKDIVAGKLIYETGGLFSKKVLAPGSGVVTKIDEFKNLYLRRRLDEKEVIKSPTEAKVVSVGDDCLELEFRADEFEGIGLNNDRAWATNGFKLVNNLSDMSFADEGKIMVADFLTPEMLIKAEVVGIKGAIVFNDCKVNNKMPILRLSEEERDNLTSELNSKRRALLNAGSGRLLLVI